MSAEFLALSIVILLFSIIVHEVMHGFVALRFGDRTALNAGRLTLNPIPHIDPVGTILLPALLLVLPALTGVHPGFFIGWAKPVPVNPLNFSDIKKGELFVSAAGIVSNFVLASIFALIYNLIPIGVNPILTEALQFAVGINLMLAVFNLVPVPPLDGSKILMALLPYRLAQEYQKFESFGMLILIVLLYSGVISTILGLLVLPLLALLHVPAF